MFVNPTNSTLMVAVVCWRFLVYVLKLNHVCRQSKGEFEGG